MLKIFAENAEHADATLPLRWCVTKEAVEKLKEEGVENPYLLIVVSRNGRDVNRQITPLFREGAAFVQFHKPGKHTIRALIIWHQKDKNHLFLFEQDAVNWLLAGNRTHGYTNDISDWETGEISRRSLECRVGFIDPENASGNDIITLDTLDVVVGEEFFAKEPPKWEQKWVNFWFLGFPPADQCAYRFRRMIAYTIQPPLVLLWMVMKVVWRLAKFSLLFLCGCWRGLSFVPVVRPFRYSAGDICSLPRGVKKRWLKSNSFLTKKCRDNAELYLGSPRDRSWWFIPLIPGLLIIELSLIGGGTYAITALDGWGYIGVVTSGILIGVAAVSALLWGAGRIFRMIRKPSRAEQDEKQKESESYDLIAVQREEKRRALDELYATNADIVCNNEPPSFDLTSIPKPRRTFRLRFLDLKRQVCRPYAR